MQVGHGPGDVVDGGVEHLSDGSHDVREVRMLVDVAVVVGHGLVNSTMHAVSNLAVLDVIRLRLMMEGASMPIRVLVSWSGVSEFICNKV